VSARGNPVGRLSYLFRTLRAGLLALIRNLPRESIKLSSINFRVPKPEVNVNVLEIGFKTSIAETRAIFDSMRAACDANERREITVGSPYGPVKWVTDCRVEKHGKEDIVVTIKTGLLEFSKVWVARDDVRRAAGEFAERFG
jgi:hypothetical protein